MKIFSNILKALLLGSLFVGVSGFAYDSDAFIIKVNTENTGSENYIFRIPTHPDYADDYNYTINCDVTGELGTLTIIKTNLQGDSSCTYSLTDGNGETTYYPDIYTISITGDFPAIYFNNGGDTEKIVEILQWGTEKWKTMDSAFRGALNLTVSAYDSPDLSEATDLSKMFRGAKSLVFTHPINNWNVSSITEMDYMFFYAEAFNQDIGAWDVSKVTTMYYMFSYARAFNQDIGAWDLSSIQEMRQMFLDAEAFNQDIGDWDLSAIPTITSLEIKLSYISVSNYDNLLKKWSLLDLVDGVSFDAGDSKYCQGEDARTLMMSAEDDGWSFTDGGGEESGGCNFYITTPTEVTVQSGEQDIMYIYTNSNSQDISYSIYDTADGNKFTIINRRLTFINPSNANNPTDINHDNIYRVQVSACDNENDDMCVNMDYQTIKVTVLPDTNGALVPTIMYLLN